MLDEQYLSPDEQKAAANFLNGPTWQTMKRVLLLRRPPMPDAGDPSHVAAAKGHQRAGYEMCIEAFETAPFDTKPDPEAPFRIPAVAITED